MRAVHERASFFPRSLSFANIEEEFPSKPRGEEQGEEGNEGARFHPSMGSSNLEAGCVVMMNESNCIERL
jgi:hypothetical protein